MKALAAQRERDALLQHYRDLRRFGAPPFQRREAYGVWFRRCCADGIRPDALQTSSRDEGERFWAHTIPGLDGHTIWTGPSKFRRNDGKSRSPQRWVWAHTHGGVLSHYEEIEIACGEPSCVNIEHLQIRPRATRRIKFSDEQAINSLKVLALQLGHTPNRREWDQKQRPITGSGCNARFGSWGKFVKAAGLPEISLMRSHSVTPALCREAIRAMHEKLGRHPTVSDWQAHRAWLKEREFPTAPNTIRRRLGVGFGAAVKRELDR